MLKLLTGSIIAGVGLITLASPVAENNVTIESSATLTDLLSLHTAGVNYELGRGVPHDVSEAAKWYTKAAELGHANAQHDLAKLYEDGRGVPRDKIRAYFWYTLATDHGNLGAALDRKTLSQEMTAAQITMAERLVDRWKARYR